MPRQTRLKAQCALAGETIGEVADAIGVARSVLYSVIRGAVAPWPKLRADLADHFGVPEARLFVTERAADRRVS